VQNRLLKTFLLSAALCAALPISGALPFLGGGSSYHLQGEMAPDFALRSWQGPNIRLSEYRGDVVALSFFGSRCGQCGTQIATLSRLLDVYESAGLAALAVNVDDDQEKAREYISAHRTAVPMLMDPEKSVARSYRVDNLPMLLIIDRSGRIRHVYRDYRNGHDAQYLDQIKALLDE